MMLHSFSHLLITAVALECGYPASSIRERIYALPGIGYGVLLYTGTSDAEGTLGGLIQVGRRIHEHVRNALELGELCSNDPVSCPASAAEYTRTAVPAWRCMPWLPADRRDLVRAAERLPRPCSRRSYRR